MGRVLRANRWVLLAVALVGSLLFGTAAVGWERVESLLALVMAILALLLVLKAASIALVIVVRSVL